MGNIWAKENVAETVGRWKRREFKDRDISNHVALSPVARLFFSAASSLPHLRCADWRSDISLLQNQPDSVRHGIYGSMIGKVTPS